MAAYANTTEDTVTWIWQVATNRNLTSVFIDLANSSPLIANIIVFAIVIYGLVIFIQLTINLSTVWHLLFSKRSWLRYASVAAVLLMAIIIAQIVVNYVRGTSLPVPDMPQIAAVIGENEVMQWSLPEARAGSSLRFEVQWSEERSFPPGNKTGMRLVDDTVIPLVATENETLWWRVRAVEDAESGYRKVGHWSKPVRIDQYKKAWDRVRESGILRVAMERSYNRSKFRFYVGAERGHDGNKTQQFEYRGVEIDLAHLIADELCKKMFMRDRQYKSVADGKDPFCLPSKPHEYEKQRNEGNCDKKDCKRIEAKFYSTGWPDVMSEVSDGKYDMAISTITYIQERETDYNILFTKQNYHETGFAFVYEMEEVQGHLTPDRKPKLQNAIFAAQNKTTSNRCLRYLRGDTQTASGDWIVNPNSSKQFEISGKQRSIVAFQNIMSKRGRYKFVVTDKTFAEGWTTIYGKKKVGYFEATPDFFGTKVPDYCKGQEYRIAVRVGEVELSNVADDVLKTTNLEDLKKHAEMDFFCAYALEKSPDDIKKCQKLELR